MTTPFPLCWPADVPRTPYPRRAAFSSKPLGRCRDDMIRQFEMLRVKKLVISTNIPLRLDGLFRADGRLERPDAGVAVYYSHPRYGPQVMACDRWTTVADNIWSIKRTVECIRSIARYGTTEMVEKAMAGFAGALPHLTPEAPWWVILNYNEQQAAVVTIREIEERARELSKRYHPDSPQGGDEARFKAIRAALDRARVTFSVGVTT